MNNLVFVKRDVVLTDSLIILHGTKNDHASIQRTISRYEKKLEEKFGKV